MQFRGDDGEWHEGTTVNIAARGLLCRTTVAMPVASELELHIVLPQGATAGADVLCSGRIVRTETSPESGETLMAVAIDQFQLRRAAPRSPPAEVS